MKLGYMISLDSVWEMRLKPIVDKLEERTDRGRSD